MKSAFRSARFWLPLAGVVVLLRLGYASVLWVEEAYPLAAARRMLAGDRIYRDFWFDKPPLFPALYAAWGALDGIPLRLAGAAFVLLCAWLAYRLGRQAWSETEGRWAAVLTAFFLTFDHPASTLVLGPDQLLIAAQFAAIGLAMRQRPLAAGLVLGAGLLVNTKALFVLAASALWCPSPWLLVGLPAAALSSWEQVWLWGRWYAQHSFVDNAWVEGTKRTLNWAGFHSALVAAAPFAGAAWRWWAWTGIMLVSVMTGARFFPRYYFLVLPPLLMLAARGLARMGARRWLILLLLAVPLVRFGPRFLNAGDPAWADRAMERDSRHAAALLRSFAGPGATVFVWGYRPDIEVLSGMRGATPFLECQPLTGVFADRHLNTDVPSVPETLPAANRRRLAATSPEFVVDGLGPYNPRLALTAFPDLGPWLARYQPVGRTEGSIIYRRRSDPNEPASGNSRW